MRYRDSGVDLSRSDRLKQTVGEAVRATWTPAVQPLTGGFAGVMEIPGTAAGAPLLAATLDGVGTKLHVAIAAERVADAAADLVRHGADDLLVHGARPFAFLDYVAQSRLDPALVGEAIRGMARACAEVGAVLLGGETAEMPDTYLPGVVDVAGCMLGVVDPDRVLDGRALAAGDILLGLGSNGLHTNGFSLARRIVERSGLRLSDRLPGGDTTLADALLAPHRWYGPALAPLLDRREIRALAHITGGGIAGNLVRVLPEGLRAEIHAGAWETPPLFRWLIEAGEVPVEDARATFNLGIGMIAACAPERAPAVMRALSASGETVHEIGMVHPGVRGVRWVDSRR